MGQQGVLSRDRSFGLFLHTVPTVVNFLWISFEPRAFHVKKVLHVIVCLWRQAVIWSTVCLSWFFSGCALAMLPVKTYIFQAQLVLASQAAQTLVFDRVTLHELFEGATTSELDQDCILMGLFTHFSQMSQFSVFLPGRYPWHQNGWFWKLHSSHSMSVQSSIHESFSKLLSTY